MLKPDRFSCSQKIRLKRDPPVLSWSDHNKPPSSFLKRLRDTQGTCSKEFLETLVDRNLDKHFRPKTPCKCHKVAKMSGREMIMDAKQKKMDKVTETKARTPTWNPLPLD